MRAEGSDPQVRDQSIDRQGRREKTRRQTGCNSGKDNSRKAQRNENQLERCWAVVSMLSYHMELGDTTMDWVLEYSFDFSVEDQVTDSDSESLTRDSLVANASYAHALNSST